MFCGGIVLEFPLYFPSQPPTPKQKLGSKTWLNRGEVTSKGQCDRYHSIRNQAQGLDNTPAHGLTCPRTPGWRSEDEDKGCLATLQFFLRNKESDCQFSFTVSSADVIRFHFCSESFNNPLPLAWTCIRTLHTHIASVYLSVDESVENERIAFLSKESLFPGTRWTETNVALTQLRSKILLIVMTTLHAHQTSPRIPGSSPAWMITP